MKHLFSFITAVALSMISISCISSHGSVAMAMEETIMMNTVLSKEVPIAAQNYGKYFFSTYSYNELLDLGFTNIEISDLSISSPFTAYEYDECDFQYYYFPVLSHNTIIAMLTMTDVGDGTYSIQFGKSSFADTLNEIYKSACASISFVITDEAMFAIDENEKIRVVNSFVNKEDPGDIDFPNISYSEIAFVNNEEIEIGGTDSVYLNLNPPIATIQTIYQNSLSVPFVANGSNSSYPGGYCWACSAASIIKYRTTTSNSAIQIRNTLLNGSYGGYDYEIQSIFQSYIGGTIQLNSGNGFMFYSTLKPIIDSGKPIYTDWQNFTSGGAHAMVVRGYYYDSSIAGPSTERATVMDPNYNTYQSIGLYPTYKYNIGTGSFSWYSSVY